MSTSTPWRQAVIGGVVIIAGIVLLSVDWTIATLAAFAGFALLARGVLHAIASAAFVGFAGAFAVLAVAGDAGVGIVVLAWPHPTVMVLSLLVGGWAVIRAVAAATIGVTTRADRAWWLVCVALAAASAVVGVTLMVRANSASVHDAAVLIGLLALLDGSIEVIDAAARNHRTRVPHRLPHGHTPSAA